MSAPERLPRAIEPFVTFATLLRRNGFAVAPGQTQTFIEAIGLLGPRSMRDIHQAAVATLAPPPERRDEFDALFRLHFLGQSLPAPARGQPDDEDELQAFDQRDGTLEPPEAEAEREVGAEATGTEALSLRQFRPSDESSLLRQFTRRAPRGLPQQKSYRRRASQSGDIWDMRRLLRDAVKRDGEVLSLPKRERQMRQRRILLLVDVSGSMKAQTDTYLRFAHALARAAERIELFTVGTRLTRVTRALRHKQRDQALDLAATLVADWDGGTRLGDALRAFLGVPRFAAFARGAAVIVLSDGLERGEVAVLRQAVEHLSRLAWRIIWLTPLAGETGYRPQTAGLQAILPFISRLGDGSRMERLCDEILDIGRSAA